MACAGRLQIRRRSSNVDGGAQEELLKSGRLQTRRRSSNVDGVAHEELHNGGKLQTRRRSSNIDIPPWGEFELEFKLE